jgi:hypothetical protein
MHIPILNIMATCIHSVSTGMANVKNSRLLICARARSDLYGHAIDGIFVTILILNRIDHKGSMNYIRL